eukprot:scaffold1892_cov85-Skeletonema_dohrnii-CCMP3373.AAC.2
MKYLMLIDRAQVLAVILKNPYTDRQLVRQAHGVIKRTVDLSDANKVWNALAFKDKTYAKLKEVYVNAYQACLLGGDEIKAPTSVPREVHGAYAAPEVSLPIPADAGDDESLVTIVESSMTALSESLQQNFQLQLAEFAANLQQQHHAYAVAPQPPLPYVYQPPTAPAPSTMAIQSPSYVVPSPAPPVPPPPPQHVVPPPAPAAPPVPSARNQAGRNSNNRTSRNNQQGTNQQRSRRNQNNQNIPYSNNVKKFANHLYCASCGCDVDHSSPMCPNKRAGHDDRVVHKEQAKAMREADPNLKMPCGAEQQQINLDPTSNLVSSALIPTPPPSSTQHLLLSSVDNKLLPHIVPVGNPTGPETSQFPAATDLDDDVTVITSNTTSTVKQRRLQHDLQDLPPYRDLFMPLPSMFFAEHHCHAAGRLDIPPGWALFDSGASGAYLTPSDAQNYATEVLPATNPIGVTLPEGNQSYSTHTCRLDWPDLPPAVTKGHVLPGLAHFSLVPVSNFAEAGCLILFDDKSVKIYYDNKCIVQGMRHPSTGLWIVPLSQSVAAATFETQPSPSYIHRAYSAYTLPTKQQAVVFMHQCLGSPPISSLLKASRLGFLKSFPHLSPSDITRHLAPSPATAKGHLRRIRKNHRSTKPKHQPSPSIIPPQPQPVPPQECNMFCLAVLADLNTGTIYNDNTGIFPVQSLDGHQLFFVTYVYDLNAILARPLKNQQSDTIIAMYKEVFAFLKSKGFTPKFNVCDNQAANAIKEFLSEQECDGQFVIPGDHRVLAAERAIQCWKNHFISTLCTTDSAFPLQLWPYLAPQAEDMLNVLRPSRLDNTKSAYEALYGAPYDFNRHPLAPPGSKAVIYEPADTRSSWGPRGVDGWYLGSAKDHYRGYQIFVPETKSIRVGNTVEFFPQHCRYRKLSPLLHAKEIVRELRQALQQLRSDQRRRLLQQLRPSAPSSTEPPPTLQRVPASTPPPASQDPPSSSSSSSSTVQRVPTSPSVQRVPTSTPVQRVDSPSRPSLLK